MIMMPGKNTIWNRNMERIGIDLVWIERVSLKESFVNTILTSYEKEAYENRTSEKTKKNYIAGRFAAKEAIFKATQDKNYLSYSILNDDSGAPYVLDHPELSISISHDGDYAVAIVLSRGE